MNVLTNAERRMLAALDDGFEPRDSVGQQLGNLSMMQRLVCLSLVRGGLVDVDRGWRGSIWCRLSVSGRRRLVDDAT